jgi:vacuolar iron transporter family protein
MADRDMALDTLAREELGLDPDQLGSPWRAAFSSMFAFAIGAFVVVVPYLAGSGTAAS